MPFVQEHGLEVLLVIFFINGFVAYGDSIFNIPLRTPFDTSITVHAAAFPQAVNASNPNNILVNETTNISNSTSTNPFIKFLQGNILTFFQWAFVIVAFISGGFIFSSISALAIGFPPYLVYVFMGAVIIFLARTAYFYIRGV